MNEEIEKIIKYFKNDAWFTIFNAEEYNDEPYKLLNPIEVNEIMDYMTKLQNNWNELKKHLEKQIIDSKAGSSQQYYFNTIYKYMQELEQVK